MFFLFDWVDWGEAAQRHEHLARGDELTMKTGFEAAESRENDAVVVGSVGAGEVVHVLIGLG